MLIVHEQITLRQRVFVSSSGAIDNLARNSSCGRFDLEFPDIVACLLSSIQSSLSLSSDTPLSHQ